MYSLGKPEDSQDTFWPKNYSPGGDREEVSQASYVLVILGLHSQYQDKANVLEIVRPTDGKNKASPKE